LLGKRSFEPTPIRVASLCKAAPAGEDYDLAAFGSEQETSELGGMDVHIACLGIGKCSFHEGERFLPVRYVRDWIDHLMVRAIEVMKSFLDKRQ
jgi:hypothetical protein